MDKDLVTAFAQATARAAASEIAAELRVELANQFTAAKKELKDELRADLRSYFGEMPRDTHIIHHSRIGRILHGVDSATESFWHRLVWTAVVVMSVGAVVLWTLSSKFFPSTH